MPMKKKLIEVALPLEAINAESAREKSIRHGHPSTLHLWWARRPLATARAVIWSSLVDDPSSHPEQFPTEEEQQKERQRLFDILSRLVVWENSNDPHILAEAKAEIMKSTDNNPPALLDPFAGGGAIPLEAQRLGLEAHAHDLNPVAVMINKAMIEIPPKFAGQAPVNPDIRNGQMGVSGSGVWTGAAGLAEDVRYYGEWMKKKAFEKIGHLYPKAKVPKEQGGGEATVIAWIWARTVKCPNPACGCEMPLASSFVLSKKKNNEYYVEPYYEDEKLEFRVHKGCARDGNTSNKKGRSGSFACPKCGEVTQPDYVKSQASSLQLNARLMAIVAEGTHGRLYLSPSHENESAAFVERPENVPHAVMSDDRRAITPPDYGMPNFEDLFTSRQLVALTTFCDLVKDAQQQAEQDAINAGLYNDHIGLSAGGLGARAYGETIGIYLAFAVDRLADRCSSICSWDTGYTKIRNTFGRQAIPMTWDYAEGNPFSDSTGCFSSTIHWVEEVLQCLPQASQNGTARQFDAQSDCGLQRICVSTDPPYYDNIGYADLSDFFYMWLRLSLKETYPKLFGTMMVPKAEELVAIPYRHENNYEKAKGFFEDGMYTTCCQIHKYTSDSIPVTIYYAFKQSDSNEPDRNENAAASGWETMLSAVIRAGFCITGTWPMRTEMANRTRGNSSNALASSIVLVCRKRDDGARSVTRREFINALHREMRPALEKLQSANIAPVDLAQSAIGPGFGVFSRYKSVLEADGKPMTVRAALQIINQELDAFYNEQEGEMDSGSRFCVDLFQQFGFNEMAFGEAQVLATAKNTSLQALADRHVLHAIKGRVHLLMREEIPDAINSSEECIWLLTQQLAHRFEKEGVKGCARELAQMFGSNAENAKALAYRLYTICERKGWAQEGYAYNNLVVAWPEILSMAASIKAETPVQMTLDDVIKEMSPAE